MEIKIFDSKEEIGKYAAGIFADVINSNDEPILGLATGSSPIPTYDELIRLHNDGKLSFENVSTFNLDEYKGLDKTHDQSYYYFMNDKLFSHVNINVDNTNIPSGTGDIKAICDAYNKMLSENVIDVQLLGIGSNGHIGFNEPGTSFDSVTHSIELDESTRIDNSIYFKSLDDVPTEAVTMGLSNIMDAKKVVLIATGEGKSWAINELVNNPKSTNVPASVLQSHKDVIILLDKEAASKL